MQPTSSILCFANLAEPAQRFGAAYGKLTLNSSTVSGNSTIYDGGGIENVEGMVTLKKSTVSGNSTTWYGGGIYSDYGALTLVNSTVRRKFDRPVRRRHLEQFLRHAYRDQ
jgi:predicted outer membrane repeat protein